MSKSESRVWLITGCTSGIGAVLAEEVLAAGDKVIATCRGDAEARLKGLAAKGASVLSLDVTASASRIDEVIDHAVTLYGSLDVLVNNAGYVMQGACEELSVEEDMAQFQTNYFGAANAMRAVLPHFRSQGSGSILNISSHCGRFSRPGFASYSASKFALEAFSEALQQEVQPFSIDVCLLELGDFRTNILDVLEGNTVKRAAKRLDAYADLAERMADYNAKSHGKQRGDPARAARVMVSLVNERQSRKIPLRLALGSDALENIETVYKEGLQTLAAWADVSQKTDFV